MNFPFIATQLLPIVERFRRADAPVTLDGPVREQMA